MPSSSSRPPTRGFLCGLGMMMRRGSARALLLAGLGALGALAVVPAAVPAVGSVAPPPGAWALAGTTSPLAEATAVVLGNGLVFVPPGNLFDPARGSWTGGCRTPAPWCPEAAHHDHAYSRAVAIVEGSGSQCGSRCGQVLWAGGLSDCGLPGGCRPDLAELYDPATGKWTDLPPTLFAHGAHPTATALAGAATECGANCGKVLVVGGLSSTAACGLGCVDGAPELYDPLTNQWTPANISVVFTRLRHTSTRLADGRVLVAGGFNFGSSPGLPPEGPTADASIFDPLTNTWRTVGLPAMLMDQTATRLSDGRVLVAGGEGCPPASSACSGACAGQGCHQPAVQAAGYLFDPGASSFTATRAMAFPQSRAAAVLLSSGRVLVAGGALTPSSSAGTTAEVYSPADGSWQLTRSMLVPRAYPAIAALGCAAAAGSAVVAGGGAPDGPGQTQAEAWSDTDGVVQGETGGSGPLRGGTLLTLHGRGLNGGAVQLRVGGQPATNVVVAPDGASVSGLTPPAAAPGTVEVSLTVGGVAATTCAPLRFSYRRDERNTAPRILTGASPECGVAGIEVHITGVNLSRSVDVSFGSSTVHAVPVDAAGRISVRAPSGLGPSPQPVVVSSGVIAAAQAPGPSPPGDPTEPMALAPWEGFTLRAGTFQSPCPEHLHPTVSGITPSCGPTAGGPVTLMGADFGFRGVTVMFGSAPVAGTADFSGDSVTVLAPAHSPGLATVALIDPGELPAAAPAPYEYSDHCGPEPIPALVARAAQVEEDRGPGRPPVTGNNAGSLVPGTPAGGPPAPAQVPVVLPQAMAPDAGLAGVPDDDRQAAPETTHAMVRRDPEVAPGPLVAGAVAALGGVGALTAIRRRVVHRPCRPAPGWAM